MLGFSNLLKSNFGDSATPSTSPLEPRLKSGQDAATSSLPEFFDTPMGERRVPRDRDPKKPNYEMMKDAREGVLSGFLRSGKIFCASDFVGIVNPKTAIITLQDIYEFETRCLATLEQSISQPPLSSRVPFSRVADKEADDGKNLRNLFFITLADDELPSFHFWTKPGDSNPVTAGKPIDWSRHFDENPPSPATAAKITMLENERKEKAQHGAQEQQNTQSTKPLDFLDRYNDINFPASGREPNQEPPADDIDSVPQASAGPNSAQSPLESEVLLQFNRGGMYLREFTYKALYAMACWLVENEEEEEEEREMKNGSLKVQDMFLDILGPGKVLRQEKVVSVSRVSNRRFQENILPNFGRPDRYFRIRSERYDARSNLESNFDSSGVGDLMYDLKLVRPNVGYCYCSAVWHITTQLRSNSLSFEKALKVLFDWELSAYPKSDHLSLDIPGHGSFELDRNSDVVVDAKIQKIFAELSGNPRKSGSHPAEITIRDVVEDVTDGSDLLGTISPRHENAKRETGPGEVPDRLQATEIRGGPDLPSIHPRLLTNTEVQQLQERLKILEASVIDTDDLQERLSVAEEKLAEMNGLQERLKTSENRARLKSFCPFCPQDWAGATRQQQQDHLKLHQKDIVHQPALQECPHPDCTAWLGEHQDDSTYEAISEHLRFHIDEEHAEDGICENQKCHANMYALTGEQQEEHESMHLDNQENKDERDRLQEKVRDLEHKASSEQHKSFAAAIEEQYDKSEMDNVDITKERDSLQDQVVELERQSKAASRLDERVHMNDPELESEVDEDPKQPSQHEALKRLRYCNVCLKSVDKMSANAKTTHADKCETSVSEFLLLTPAQAKAERERRNNSHDATRPQERKGTEEEAEVPNTEGKRKKKASAKAAPLESQQDEAEDTSTVQRPGASKSTGRKTPKRKLDRFKPPKEDESDEEPESPRKKPKLKAKAAKTNKEEYAPTRRSTRSKDVHEPPVQQNDLGEDGEEVDEPSSSAKGGKRKKRAAAVATSSKKAKTKK